jgi:hypothetical protein
MEEWVMIKILVDLHVEMLALLIIVYKYSCCNSLKASSDEYLVYSGGIYTTPKNTG